MPIVEGHDCPKKDSLGYKYQTARYGAGRVVANSTTKCFYQWRCTICGKEFDGRKVG